MKNSFWKIRSRLIFDHLKNCRKPTVSQAIQEKRREEEDLKKEVQEKRQIMEKEFGGAPMSEKQLKEYGNELRRQG